MLRGFARALIVATALIASSAAGADNLEADIKLPPGTRRDPSAGYYVAGRGLRDSTDFIAKELARGGIAVEQVGPYRVRGVELTRFLSQSSSTMWVAIHVMRKEGKTLIFFVPRAKP
jgi:hypothetical protein